VDPGSRLILAFDVVQLKVAVTFEAVASPVLHTLAPIWNVFGPTFTLLLSSPITPHEIGVIVRIGAPDTCIAGRDTNAANGTKIAATTAIAAENRFIVRLLPWNG
jgi:hypothetical protein